MKVASSLSLPFLAFALLATSAQAGPNFPEFEDPHPSPGNGFGSTIVPLSTGNVVITSPNADIGGTDNGAVYLFNGATGALISTLTGSTDYDRVGGGVTALTNGNFVVSSGYWDNGAVPDAGAVTWGNGTTGVTGLVSAANSLVGSSGYDYVGGVTVLTNGNYVVSSIYWDNGAVVEAGAVTWGNGTTGVTGLVSAANSLVGSSNYDYVGHIVLALTNGNYVVSSFRWANGAVVETGAVTWGNGTTGIHGAVSAANSLVGSSNYDRVGYSILALTNGNFVVSSTGWDNGAVANAGAVTWGNGTTGLTGLISAANSLVGSTVGDSVGGVTALTNGNYVVSSPYWDNGAVRDAGAATWGDGTTGITGAVTEANSLFGSWYDDRVGYSGVTALTNGNYVVRSPRWDKRYSDDRAPVRDVGAATWGDGTTGSSGAVTEANSLIGSQGGDGIYVYNEGDQVGVNVVPLTNGNYVVSSPYWDNGAAREAGAVTWGDGTTGLTGVVSAANSLVGSSALDRVGGVIALTNGNYVVNSYLWDNGAVVDAGAVTWGNGTTGVTGLVSVANSLVGSTAGESVGYVVTALTNGNYVVGSPLWYNGAESYAGAVTWGNGSAAGPRLVGAVTTVNSLVGSTNRDYVGDVTALANGNYVVTSRYWDNGALIDAGAVIFGNGTTGVAGEIIGSNSALGLVDFTIPYFPSLDNVNNHFITGFIGEGKVRVGSQLDGFVNFDPTDITLSNASIAEHNAAHATIGTLTATEVAADSGQMHNFALVSGAGDMDNDAFTIIGDTLTINGVANYATKPSYSIRIRTTDSGIGNLSFEKSFTITVTTIRIMPSSSIAENNAPNATVGTLAAVGPDPGQTYTYSLVPGAGSSDNGSFTINTGNVLRLIPSANYEAKNSYALRVRAIDNGAPPWSLEKALTVTITNLIDTYGEWITFKLPTATPAEKASDFDYDNDGKHNGWEYILDVDPAVHEETDLEITKLSTETVLTYPRRSGLPAGLDTPHWSLDAIDYSAIPSGQFTRDVTINGSSQADTVTIHVPDGVDPRTFFKIVVTGL